MKVAIIGSRGQLGQDLVKTAPSQLDLVTFTRGDFDITDRIDVFDFLAGEEKFDVVINTAAFHRTDQCEDEPEKAFLVNATGVKNLAEACDKANAILIHISTDYVFDGGKIKTKEPYYEDDAPNPVNIYGVSKLAGEYIVRNYLEKYYIVRSSSLYGVAGASGKGGNFPYTILKKAKAGEKLRVVDDMYMVPTHTFDLAQGIWRLLLERHPYGVYHITHEGYCTWYEFAVKILETVGLKADIEPVKHTAFPTRAKRPLWSVLGTRKGVKLPPWEEGLRRFVDMIN
ncbi:MAG TPA: dTDP-4-dehydrorhamnose reductase [Aquifex aeolicus]|uniref:dTDP-4-dehydrorhamnose reductase n=1 Tax=Aquifex aeolicus TaxID=63363 RepID=A0A7C5Q815_AQUAO|nr:dTDP-4-dehydrorhamnose reductase [Aquifex aeolicus]